MKYSSLRTVIRQILTESSAARRAQTGAITGDRNTKLEIWRLADSLITTPPSAHFTMTSVQKVGINPGSSYNTPLALYAYPVTELTVDQLMGVYLPITSEYTPEEMEKAAKNKAKVKQGYQKQADFAAKLPMTEVYRTLPFVADAPFVNFFKLKPDGVYYTTIGMTPGQYDAAMQSLAAYTKQHDPGTERVYGTPEEAMEQIVDRAKSFHKMRGEPDDVGRLKLIWTVTRAWAQRLADQVQAGDIAGLSPRSMAVWRRLLLVAGVKAVVDDGGLSLVHPAEPTQTAVLDTSIVEVIRQFDNRTMAATGLPGQARSEAELPKSLAQSGDIAAAVNLALQRGKTVNLSDYEMKTLQMASEAAAAGQNSFLAVQDRLVGLNYQPLIEIEKVLGKKFNVLTRLFDDMVEAMPENWTLETSNPYQMMFQQWISSRDMTQSDEQLRAIKYTLAAIEAFKNAGLTTSDVSRALEKTVYTPLARQWSTARYPELNFLETNADVLSAFTDLIQLMASSDDSRVINILREAVRGTAMGGTPRLLPAFAKILVEKGWPDSLDDQEMYDRESNTRYTITRGNAWNDIQMYQALVKKRREKIEAQHLKWTQQLQKKVDNEEEWNPVKSPALGSIYKDPKFARKHTTATRGKPKITKYEDEDEA
jgi:hypothetical protein